jgi:hypothetical protein
MAVEHFSFRNQAKYGREAYEVFWLNNFLGAVYRKTGPSGWGAIHRGYGLRETFPTRAAAAERLRQLWGTPGERVAQMSAMGRDRRRSLLGRTGDRVARRRGAR